MKLQKLKQVLKTYHVSGCELERWGGNRDGGYILYPQVAERSDVLYTYGIGHSTTFENEYCEKTGNAAIAFDHTVRRLPHPHENLVFVKEGVAGETRPKMDTYENHHKKYGGTSPLLKIDIEGWEYEVLTAIPDELLTSSTGILLEVHNLSTRLDEFITMMERINRDFALVHLHPNNWGITFDVEGYQFPDVLELSFVNRKEFVDIQETVLSLPLDGLDRKNHSRRPDIYLNYLYENSF